MGDVDAARRAVDALRPLVVLAVLVGYLAWRGYFAAKGTARAAAGAVWDAFLGDLRTTGWIVAGAGAVGVWTKADSVTVFDGFSYGAGAAK